MAVCTAPLVGVAFHNNNCNPRIPLQRHQKKDEKGTAEKQCNR